MWQEAVRSASSQWRWTRRRSWTPRRIVSDSCSSVERTVSRWTPSQAAIPAFKCSPKRKRRTPARRAGLAASRQKPKWPRAVAYAKYAAVPAEEKHRRDEGSRNGSRPAARALRRRAARVAAAGRTPDGEPAADRGADRAGAHRRGSEVHRTRRGDLDLVRPAPEPRAVAQGSSEGRSARPPRPTRR